MSHDPHLGFIIAAYALGFLIVAGMVGTIVADYLNLKQALASLSRKTRQHPMEEMPRRDVTAQDPDREGLA
ncbi:MAG: heme exporter protein CcmD [Methylocella sp.]